MKKIIKKILKENRFDTSAHQQLSDANSKTARLHGVDPDDWYLGTQIYYKHGWLGKESGNCIFLGSPDYEILVEKLVLINPNFWKREDKGYKKYCDIINQYYDLDNFSIESDDKSVYDFLDRFVNLVFLDEDIDAEMFLTNPEEYEHLLGFEYNDWDPEDEIGTHKTQMTAIIYGIFNRDIDDTLNNWVNNKIKTEQFRYV
jgi:hypothetical protein